MGCLDGGALFGEWVFLAQRRALEGALWHFLMWRSGVSGRICGWLFDIHLCLDGGRDVSRWVRYVHNGHRMSLGGV